LKSRREELQILVGLLAVKLHEFGYCSKGAPQLRRRRVIVSKLNREAKDIVRPLVQIGRVGDLSQLLQEMGHAPLLVDAKQLHQYRRLVGEVVIDGSDVDAGPLGDDVGIQTLDSTLHDDVRRRVQDAGEGRD